MKKGHVVVGMSGGVDSSVTALLMKQQGYDVTGLFMKNWEEKDGEGVCKSAADFDDVRRVCDHLDIPFYGINFVEEYRNNVFAQFLEDLKKGLTPNPDILCNREIKFKVFLEKALALGADFLATGHYCQNLMMDGHPSLVKGIDPNKDQTYFLYTINRDILKKVLFPVGGIDKSEVRRLAREHGLATAEKKDSTGICFIGKRDFGTFIKGFLELQPGPFMTLNGKKVGQHAGVASYTLGQRKGLGIGGPGEAWFVVAKDPLNQIVYVEQGADHPALYCDELDADELSWVAGTSPTFPYTCQAKVRYRQADQECCIEPLSPGRVRVRFTYPQRAVTPGQSIVFYQQETCLGGGVIRSAGPSYHSQDRSLPFHQSC